MVYGCSSEPEGEVGVTGWWQQMVDATRMMDRAISERNHDTVCRVSRKETEGQHSEVPANRACCNGINDAESSSLLPLSTLSDSP